MSETTQTASDPGRIPSEPPPASNANGTAKPKSTKPKPKPAPPAPKPKATKVLPTDRITTARQFEMLRAYAIASGPESRSVTNDDIAKLVNMQASTVAMANSFFTTLSFLIKTDVGFIASPDVVNFNRAFQWNAETAAAKLSPALERSWFWQSLFPHLQFQGAMEERQAIEILASEASAAPHHRKQLLMLLEYLAAVGLIQRENGTIILNQPSQLPKSGESKGPATNDAPSAAPAASPLASALFPSSANGAVHFNISVQVNMAELAGWQADRIASFFAGIAQVLAARGKTEDGTA